MITGEVTDVEKERNEQLENQPEQIREEYVPRPKWQVWAARIGLVIVILGVILYYWHIASGGLQ